MKSSLTVFHLIVPPRRTVWLVSLVLASVWLATLVFNGASATRASRPVSGPMSGQPSLGELLNPDGTLNLSRGFQGSLNPQGYRLGYTANGAPRFGPAAPTSGGAWDSQFVNANGVQRFAYVMAVSGTDMYLGGQFTTAGTAIISNLAKWNGSSWSALGGGVNGAVYALAVSGSDLYVGGDFTMAGGAPANNIAKWNGSSWSALGSGVSGSPSDNVRSLAISGSDVYVGGSFTMAGGNPASNIAKWNGSTWSPLGSGISGGSGTVHALAISGNNVYAGGDFGIAGGNLIFNVARWDGSAWFPLGSGTQLAVFALAVSGNDLYVGGQFPTAGGMSANNIAKWNGSAWSTLGSGVTLTGSSAGTVSSILVVGANVYVSGAFDTAGGNPANSVAVWNGSTWAPLGNGLSNGSTTLYGLVSSLALSGTDIYAAGAITKSGSTEINRIAKWNGSAWSPLGNTSNSVNNIVYALAVIGNDVYVGGEFDFAGGVAANNIAKWNGSTWSALGSGLDFAAFSMAVMGGDLYVSGFFSTAGGNPANGIARWNGSAWSPLGGGITNGYALALAVSGTNLCAGGSFTTAGGVPANRVACWNGSSWSALGSGVNDNANRLAASGNDLYVGGRFTTAGGLPASRIAKWNGTTWSALGSGVNNEVGALATSGNDLYVGGNFSTTGGNPTTSLAKWNGSTWSVLSTGNDINNVPYALALQGTSLFVGGGFTTIGGTLSHYFGRLGCSLITLSPTTLPNGAVGANYNQTLTASPADTYTFTLSAGQLPNGLTLSSAGVLSGLPTQSGVFNFIVTASSGICNGSGSYTLTVNAAPSITPSGALVRIQGSPASNSTIATVSDAETPANSLIVTVTSANPSNGVTISHLTNTNGTITADIIADCTATNASFTLQVSDGTATVLAPLNVGVTANPAPSLSYGNVTVLAAGSTANSPTTASDNGSIAGYAVQAQGSYTGVISVNASGVVSISNAAPVGMHIIMIRATDNCGSTTDATFTLNVTCPSSVVTNGNDSGAGSLRQLIADACAGSTITFQTGVTTVTLTSAELLVNKNLTIDGGSGVTVTRSTAGGTPNFRIFRIQSGTVAMNRLTVSNGNDPVQAGGIYNGGTLTLTACVITGNTAPQGGGLQSDGVLTLTNCTVSQNVASDFGGGLKIFGPTTTLTNCTFSNNQSAHDSSAIESHTGGTLTLTNCTIANNQAGTGAGQTGGALFANSGTVLKNTIVTNNTGNNANIAGTVNTANSFNNLIGAVGNGGLTNGVNGNLIGVANANTLLATLGNYGGPTPTIALLPGSPAINAGTATGAPANDQRGIARVGNTDIGAFESRGFTLALASGNNQSAFVNTAFANPLAVMVTAVDLSEPVNGGKVTFTPPGSGASATIAGNPVTIASGIANGNATANGVVGGPYIVAANASGATPAINFALTNTNPPPTIMAGTALTRQQGTSGFNSTIATVSDANQAAGTLTVTATTVPAGITVTALTNTAGTITANVAASCAATIGTNTIVLTVTDGNSGTATANLTVNVTANTAPALSYATVSVNAGASTSNAPMTATDNGSITGYAIQSQGTYAGTILVNASGVVSISGATPVGAHAITIRATDNCGVTTDASFTLTVGNNLPTITPAAALTRQQGTAGTDSTIATVSDNDTPAGNLIVTATSVPTGITVASLTNTNGVITANIAASCSATVGINTIVLTVTDSNNGMATGSVTVNVTANTAPSLGYPASSVMLNAATTINPTTASDNGSITGFSLVSVVPALSSTPTVNASGVVSITNAGPFGSHTLTVRATDNCGATTDASFTLDVGCATINVTPATLINGLTFIAYSATLSANGGSAPYAFSLASGTLPAGLSLSGNMISGTPVTAGASTFTIRVTDDNGCMGEQPYTLLIGSTGLMYYPLARPVRLLDTRSGLSPNACFQPNAPIPGGVARLQPARGTCEGLTIPANATTITGNITTVHSGGGFLTIYPSDAPQPLVANTNYLPNEVLNNAFTVGVGAQDGAVKIFVTSDTDVVVDVTGYYAPPASGGLYFHPLPRPVRLLETRAGFAGCYAPAAPLPGGLNTLQQGTGSCDGLTIPTEAQALVGNATTVNPQGSGYLTLYPANAAQPLIASSNYGAGQTVNGPFTVGLAPNGQFKIFPQWTTELVIDITGYYSAQMNDLNGQGLLFTSLGSPLRLLDTRAGQQGCYTPGAPMAANTVYTQQTQSPCTNLTPTARALIGNATVVNTTGEGYLTFWPGEAAQPLVATSNFTAGQVFNRYFTVGLAVDGSFKRFAARTTDLVVDISGFFAP